MLPLFKNGAYYEFSVKYKVLKIHSSAHTHTNELTATTTINIILAEHTVTVIILMTVDPHKTCRH